MEIKEYIMETLNLEKEDELVHMTQGEVITWVVHALISLASNQYLLTERVNTHESYPHNVDGQPLTAAQIAQLIKDECAKLEN